MSKEKKDHVDYCLLGQQRAARADEVKSDSGGAG